MLVTTTYLTEKDRKDVERTKTMMDTINSCTQARSDDLEKSIEAIREEDEKHAAHVEKVVTTLTEARSEELDNLLQVLRERAT